MKKIISLVAALICFYAPLQGQESAKDSVSAAKAAAKLLKLEAKNAWKAHRERYLHFETGAGFGQTADLRMAANRYVGSGLYLGAAMLARSPKRLAYHDLWATRLLALTQSHGKNLAFNSFNESQGLYLRRTQVNDWTLHYGGGWTLLTNARIHPFLANSSLHLESLLSAQAGVQAEREVRLPLLGAYRLEYLLRLPVVSGVLRLPAYSLSGFGGPSLAIAPFGDFTRISSRIAIGRNLRPGNPNRWQLAYSWDFYAYNDNEIHPLRVANHALTYTLLIRTGRVNAIHP